MVNPLTGIVKSMNGYYDNNNDINPVDSSICDG